MTMRAMTFVLVPMWGAAGAMSMAVTAFVRLKASALLVVLPVSPLLA